MTPTVKVRISRGETMRRRRAAAYALEAAGVRRRSERRGGHTVAVWVR